MYKTGRRYAVYIRRVAGILAGIVIFIGISGFLDEMYVKYSDFNDFWHAVLWQQYYENEGKIDRLFLGSSHVYCDIDPKRLDQLTGENHFNLASTAQPLNGSYYLLRDADNRNRLSHVYLELYHYCNQNDIALNDYDRNWRNIDHMRWSFDKVAYMLSIGGEEQYINTLFPYTRYRKYLGDETYIRNTFYEKRELNYRNYQWENEWTDRNGRSLIREKGFMDTTRTLKDEDKYFARKIDLKETSIGKQSEKYLRKIIAYCQKRDIPLTLFVSPMHNLELVSTQDYDGYIIELRELAAEYNLTVYDFNLVKEEYLPLQDSDFRDAGHLNVDGAALFTPFFNQVVSGGEADSQKYFYTSYKEKLQSLAPAVYGAYYTNDQYDPTEGEETRKVWIASNRDTEMEYQITLTPDEGESHVIREFEENKEFYIPRGETGTCTIEARMKTSPNEVVQALEIRY